MYLGSVIGRQVPAIPIVHGSLWFGTRRPKRKNTSHSHPLVTLRLDPLDPIPAPSAPTPVERTDHPQRPDLPDLLITQTAPESPPLTSVVYVYLNNRERIACISNTPGLSIPRKGLYEAF